MVTSNFVLVYPCNCETNTKLINIIHRMKLDARHDDDDHQIQVWPNKLTRL